MAGSFDWLGLNGKTVAITGASGGIGRSIAAGFAAAGAKLALLDRSEADVRQVAAELEAEFGCTTLAKACDVSSPASVGAVADEVLAELGACDVLVNNAGIMGPGALDTLSFEAWNAVLSINLTGCLLCAQAFGAQMRSSGKGSIVSTASISGSYPQPASGAYSASKAGVIMLSRQLAVEWGPLGIRSNVVSPGLVETPMTQTIYAPPGVREKRAAAVPLRRIAHTQDMTDAVLFLASDRASYVTGDEVTVDGGYSRMIMGMIPRPGFDEAI